MKINAYSYIFLCIFMTGLNAPVLAQSGVEKAHDKNYQLLMLNDVTNSFAENFAPIHGPLNVVSDNGALKQASYVEGLLKNKGYRICEFGVLANKGCKNSVSILVTELDADVGIFNARVLVDQIIQVSRLYILSHDGQVTPGSAPYVINYTDNFQVARALERRQVLIPTGNDIITETDMSQTTEPFGLQQEIVQSNLFTQTQEQNMVDENIDSGDNKLTTSAADSDIQFENILKKNYWRVQILASVDQPAMLNLCKKLTDMGVDAVLVYQEPFFKLQTGHYSTKAKAWTAQRKWRQQYPGAFTVKYNL